MAGGYKNLIVYQEAYQLALDLHKETITFPRYEINELGSQLRRASKSISLNIAEGYGKRTKGSNKDFIRFLRVTLGSADEITVGLNFSNDLGYIPEEKYQSYLARCNKIGKQLTRLINSLED